MINVLYWSAVRLSTGEMMTEELFRQDGYVSEFEAEVVEVKDDWVRLDGTAFYPGGGGQVCDTGTIGGCKVTEVKYEGKDIVHKVPGNGFNAGDRLWCSVDWERRYDLMKGHTAEHILFNSLHRQDPDLEIVKIFISPESKYVIIDRDMELSKIADAVRFANQVVADNLPVTKSVMSKDDPEIATVRIKLERIEEDEVTVVEIGDVDKAACSGVHVMETSEIGTIYVSRKVSAGKDGFAVHFEVGDKAKAEAMDLAYTCMQVIEDLGSKPEDIVRTVSNMKNELEESRRQLKAAVAASLRNLEPEVVNGTPIYTAVLPTSDKTPAADACEKRKSEGGVCAFVCKGQTLTVMIASGNKAVDCKRILADTMAEFGGRGGGKPDFAQGGVPDTDKADAVLESMRAAILQSL